MNRASEVELREAKSYIIDRIRTCYTAKKSLSLSQLYGILSDERMSPDVSSNKKRKTEDANCLRFNIIPSPREALYSRISLQVPQEGPGKGDSIE